MDRELSISWKLFFFLLFSRWKMKRNIVEWSKVEGKDKLTFVVFGVINSVTVQANDNENWSLENGHQINMRQVSDRWTGPINVSIVVVMVVVTSQDVWVELLTPITSSLYLYWLNVIDTITCRIDNFNDRSHYVRF